MGGVNPEIIYWSEVAKAQAEERRQARINDLISLALGGGLLLFLAGITVLAQMGAL